MADKTDKAVEAEATDILFDCPLCGKSLTIDGRGAGMTISCPDCKSRIKVPHPSVGDEVIEEELSPVSPLTLEAAQRRIGSLTEALEASQSKVALLVESLEEVRDRRRYLERLRTDNLARFELINKELVTIQNAMDRIVSLLQDASTERREEFKANSDIT